MRKQIQNFVLLLVIPYSLSRGMDSNDAWKFLLRKAMSSVQLANSGKMLTVHVVSDFRCYKIYAVLSSTGSVKVEQTEKGQKCLV